VDRHRRSWSIGAAAIMGFAYAATRRHPRLRQLHQRREPGHRIAAKGGHLLGILFAIALLDASIIGAFAVSLSTAYAVGDVFGVNHSLHRGVKQAKGFYAVYAGVIGGPRPSC
jgi:Mn2+/Fe2+ NRAMP family transporter